MWADYGGRHSGLCIRFSNKVLSDENRIERTEVMYSNDGFLHPLTLGYLETYRHLYATKSASYRHERELRFFFFGNVSTVRVKSSYLQSIILGRDALSMMSDPTAGQEQRRNLLELCERLVKRNASQTLSDLYLARWNGYHMNFEWVPDIPAFAAQVAS
jgi:hypothetical protein